jgi:hypothetical protein
MSYTIVGTAYVHKYQHEDGEWFHDELQIHASCSLPSYPEAREDFHITIAGYGWDDIPDEEGIYAVQYAATIHWHTDYWGEHDCDAEIHWKNIVKLTPEEEKYAIGIEEKFEDLVEVFTGPVEKL